MKPIKTFGAYVVCIATPDEEDVTARHHFIKECGWTSAQFAKIARFPWFRVEVSLWKDGEEIHTEHLGCCSYKTREEFYTIYQSDYFADMVLECATESKDDALIATVKAWRADFREKESAKSI